jgi:hypothetical protein
MLNLTLTITAAPELLAAMSTFTNAITAAKVVTIPQNISSKEQKADTYKQQMPSALQTVPTTAQSYTMEQLAVAATQIVDAGRRTELVGLLSSFSVQALTSLPKDQYGAFATQLRALGAKI